MERMEQCIRGMNQYTGLQKHNNGTVVEVLLGGTSPYSMICMYEVNVEIVSSEHQSIRIACCTLPLISTRDLYES